MKRAAVRNAESRPSVIFQSDNAERGRKRRFRPLLRSLGIQVPRGNGFHAFRHANATLMNSFGASQKLRQQRLGHADGSPVTETIYTHVISEDGKRIAAQLGKAVGGVLDPSWTLNGELGSPGSASFPPTARFLNRRGYSLNSWWTNEIAIDPSPTAEATRLTLPPRTSPAAKTPGRLVSSK
jgi:hypothetical protein